MTASHHSGSSADTAAAAILSITGALMLLSQLDIVSSKLHLSQLPPWIEWWPVLLVISGAGLLAMHRSATTRSEPPEAGDRSKQYGENQ